MRPMTDETTLVQAPTPTPPPVHVRLRHGMRRTQNWVQLLKFVAVGGSGYAVNLLVYAAVHEGLGIGHLRSATVAFVVAVFNNFWWNRHWTFDARAGHAGHQAVRFLVVSIAAFLVNFVVLELLVTAAGLKEVVAQAIAVAAATPCNFIGNKLWTFTG